MALTPFPSSGTPQQRQIGTSSRVATFTGPTAKFNATWQRRSKLLANAGYSPVHIKAVQSYDASLVKQGRKGLTDLQSYVAAHAIASKKQELTQHKSGGGLLGFIGHAFEDVGSIVTNIIPNTASFIYHLPSEVRDEYRSWTDEKWRKKHGFEGEQGSIFGDLAAAARNLTKHPIMQILPLVHTLANLTTSEGRHWIGEHPISTALDVGAAVAPVVKGATLARGLEEGVELGRTSSLALEGGKLRLPGKTMGAVGEEGSRATTLAEKLGESSGPLKALGKVKAGSAGESFARGNLYQGIFRALGETGLAKKLIGGDLEHPLSQFGQIMETAAAKGVIKSDAAKVKPYPRVYPRTSELMAKLAESAPLGGLGKSQREYISRVTAVAARKYNIEAEGVAKMIHETLGKVPTEQRKMLVDALTLETTDAEKAAQMVSSLPREAHMAYQAVVEHMNKVTHEAAMDVAAAREAGDNLTQFITKSEGEGKGLVAIPHEEAMKAATAAGKDKIEIPHGDQTWYYAKTDRVATKYIRWQKALQRLSKAEGAAADLTHTVPTDEAVKKAAKTTERLRKAADAEGASFYKSFHNNPPRVMHGPVKAGAIGRAESALNKEADAKYAAGDPTLTANEIARRQADLYTQDVRAAGVSEKEWGKFLTQSKRSWLDLAHAGIRPVFIPHVPEGTMLTSLFSRPIDDAARAVPEFFKGADIHNNRPGVGDLELALTYSGTAVLREHASKELSANKLATFGHTFDEAVQFVKNSLTPKETRGKSATEMQRFAENKVREEYNVYSRTTGGRATNVNWKAYPKDDQIWIPKTIDHSYDRALGEYRNDRNWLGGFYDKSTHLFRFAVTTSPRHVVHVFVSGMVAATAEQGFAPFTHLGQAWKAVRSDEEALKLYDLTQHFEHGAAEELGSWSTDQMRSAIDGQIKGHALRQVLGTPAKTNEWLRKQEERIGNMWRVASYLTEQHDLLKSGMSVEMARARAVELANYIHLDFDGMAPFERTIQRNLIPFMSFERQIFRYLIRYPADHPLRAAVLMRIANMQGDDWKSGLPGVFSEYLPLGSASGNGDLTVIPVQTINPFRSLGEGRNPFEITGLVSQLNPVERTLLDALGVNTLTGNIDRQLTQHVDPFYGSMVDDKKSWLSALFHNYIPQSDLIAGWFGVQTTLDYLKQTNPDAYRHAIASIVGMPFVPFDVNLYNKRLTLQLNYYKQAQADVTAATHSGDVSGLSDYPLVPYHGELVDTSRLRALIEQAQHANPNLPPSSVIPSSTHLG